MKIIYEYIINENETILIGLEAFYDDLKISISSTFKTFSFVNELYKINYITYPKS